MEKSQFETGWKMYVAAIATSGAAFYLSTGLEGVWIFAWVAPLPVLLVAFRGKARATAATAFVSFLLGGLSLFPYLLSLVPPPVAVLALAGPAAAFLACVLAARWVTLRTRNWASVFIFPAAWTSYEFIFSRLSAHGTFGSLAYTQSKVLPLVQVASVTGLWGDHLSPPPDPVGGGVCLDIPSPTPSGGTVFGSFVHAPRHNARLWMGAFGPIPRLNPDPSGSGGDGHHRRFLRRRYRGGSLASCASLRPPGAGTGQARSPSGGSAGEICWCHPAVFGPGFTKGWPCCEEWRVATR